MPLSNQNYLDLVSKGFNQYNRYANISKIGADGSLEFAPMLKGAEAPSRELADFREPGPARALGQQVGASFGKSAVGKPIRSVVESFGEAVGEAKEKLDPAKSSNLARMLAEFSAAITPEGSWQHKVAEQIARLAESRQFATERLGTGEKAPFSAGFLTPEQQMSIEQRELEQAKFAEVKETKMHKREVVEPVELDLMKARTEYLRMEKLSKQGNLQFKKFTIGGALHGVALHPTTGEIVVDYGLWPTEGGGAAGETSRANFYRKLISDEFYLKAKKNIEDRWTGSQKELNEFLKSLGDPLTGNVKLPVIIDELTKEQRLDLAQRYEDYVGEDVMGSEIYKKVFGTDLGTEEEWTGDYGSKGDQFIKDGKIKPGYQDPETGRIYKGGSNIEANWTTKKYRIK